MRWPARVWHIVANDLVRLRVWLSIYLVLMALATRGALGAPTDSGGTGTSPIVVVIGIGMLVTIILVQVDSPIRVDAFWRQHPISPSSMFAAKLVLALIYLVGVGAVGEYAALRALSTSASQMAWFLLVSAAAYTPWLCAAMLVGAVTRSIGAAAAAVIVILLAFYVTLVAFGHGGPVTPGVHNALVCLAVLSTVVFLGRLYRARDAARIAQVGGAAVPGMLFLVGLIAGTDPERSPAPSPVAGSIAGPNPSVALTIVDTGPLNLAVGLRMRMTLAGRRPSDEFSLGARYLSMYRHSRPPVQTYLTGQPPVEADGWSAVPTEPASADSMFTSDLKVLNWKGDQVLPSGFDSIVANCVLIRRALRVLGRLPLRQGASFVADGTRIGIESIEIIGGSVTVRVTQDGVTTGTPSSNQHLVVTLVNRHRTPTVIRFRGMGGPGSPSLGLPVLLPGVSRTNFEVQYSGLELDSTADRASAEWLAGAELEISELVAMQSTSVHAVVVVP